VFPAGYNEWRHSLEIKVTGEGKENKANTDVLATLAAFFDCPSKDLRIVSGEKGREKTVLFVNKRLENVLKTLEVAFHG
jgi:hypothetical protein